MSLSIFNRYASNYIKAANTPIDFCWNSALLVILVSISLAARYQEHINIRVSDMINTFKISPLFLTKDQIRAAVMKVLQGIDCIIGTPTVVDFLDRAEQVLEFQGAALLSK